jgi:uncharacterized alkaline shock family protein YloU
MRWRFGSNRRLVATIEWLRLCPKPGFLAQITQTRDTQTILSGRNARSIARNRRRRWHVSVAMSRAQLTAVPGAGEVAGELVVPNEVIAQIVGLTVLECYGVVGMAATSLSQGVARLLSRERITQGVSVRRESDAVTIDLYVVVEYGLNLAEVAATVRSRVKYTVEKLTGLPVGSLQIHIQGVKRTT